jgi:hypothetical protein
MDRGDFSLEEVLSILAESPRVANRLKEKFGPKLSKSALLMLRRAKLTGDLGDTVYGFLLDEIPNNAEEVFTIYAWGSAAGAYSVSVVEYEGVFFVQAPDFDDVGYFTSKEDAKSYIHDRWGEAIKEAEEKDQEE